MEMLRFLLYLSFHYDKAEHVLSFHASYQTMVLLSCCLQKTAKPHRLGVDGSVTATIISMLPYGKEKIASGQMT